MRSEFCAFLWQEQQVQTGKAVGLSRLDLLRLFGGLFGGLFPGLQFDMLALRLGAVGIGFFRFLRNLGFLRDENRISAIKQRFTL